MQPTQEMLAKFFSCILLLCFLPVFGQHSKIAKQESIDAAFPLLSTAHLYPSIGDQANTFSQLQTISDELISHYQSVHLSTKYDARHYAYGQYQLNSHLRLLVVAELHKDDQHKFVGFIYSTKEQMLRSEFILASYIYLEGAMEETVNSWIIDANENGSLDIITKKWLTDFELPNEYSDNITGGTSTFYQTNQDSLSWDIIPEWTETLQIIK